MQNAGVLLDIIHRDNPAVSAEEANTWITFLQQLYNCNLLSAISPEISKEKWLEHRKVGIGGSEIATILGENHWSSPRQVWLSKISPDANNQQSEPARWGNLLETIVATEWATRTGRKWVHIPVILQHAECPWMIANVDGFTLSEDGSTITGILEIKTTSEYNRQEWEEGPLPYNYICQANWYCGITGLSEIELVCLVGGQKLCYHTLPFDVELFQRETEAADTFWNENVLKFIEPEATGKDVDAAKAVEYDETLPAKYFEDDETERIVDTYCKLRSKITELTKIKEALYAQIFLAMDKNTQAVTKTHTLTIKKTPRRACNFDLLSESYPEAYNDCVQMNVSISVNVR